MNNLVPSSNSGLMSPGEFQTALKEALAVPMKSRPYTAHITRNTPSAFVFLLDQSGSMNEIISFRGDSYRKSEAVATIVNETLREIQNRCQKTDGIRDYFDIALIGYGNKDNTAELAWSGALAGKGFVKPSELKQFFLSEEEIVTEKMVRGKSVTDTKMVKTWVQPVASGLTPMNSALLKAADLLENWIVAHKGKDIFPPIVINITDGQATDAKGPELLKTARRIKDLHTSDGNVLLLNIHLSNIDEEPVLFPSSQDLLPNDEHAVLLYDMSSEMPKIFNPEIARITHVDTGSTYTGMAYNADANMLIQMMQIGTNTSLNRLSPGNA